MSKHVRHKIAIVGDVSVGKTSIITTMTNRVFRAKESSTIGAGFVTKTVTLDDNTIVKFEIWDTAGQERFRSLLPMYTRNASAILFVFDLSDSRTLDQLIDYWIPSIANTTTTPDNCIYYVIGNKADLNQELSGDVEERLNATGCNYKYFKTSAKTGSMVDQLAMSLAKDLISVPEYEHEKAITVTESVYSNNWCCW